MEHIHFLLTLGIVPNLYSPQDWEELKNISENQEIQNMTLDVFQKNILKRILEIILYSF